MYFNKFLVVSCIIFMILNLHKMLCFEITTKHVTKKLSCNNYSESIIPFALNKWQAVRVSRKNHDLVNMLWRKTRPFTDLERTTLTKYDFIDDLEKVGVLNNMPKHRSQTTFNYRLTSLHPSQIRIDRNRTSTPSSIEFYYDNEFKSISGRRKPTTQKNITYHLTKDAISKSNLKSKFLRFPFLSIRDSDYSFHLDSPISVHKKSIINNTFNDNPAIKPKEPLINSALIIKKPLLGLKSDKPINTKMYNIPDYFFDNFNRFNYPIGKTTNKAISQELSAIPTQSHLKRNIESTTLYDKIKFFELYDEQTHKTYDAKRNFSYSDLEMFLKRSSKLSKENNDKVEEKRQITFSKTMKVPGLSFRTSRNNHDKRFVTKMRNELKTRNLINIDSNIEKNISALNESSCLSIPWHEYPFVSAYIYEPSQVHCDAAALSPHWLIAAASCLSEIKTKVNSEPENTAYVTYCSESWRNPKRVTYVKYTVIHPQYSKKNYKDRIFYNVGAIQVITSMSACNGWQPAIIMSRLFVPKPEGSQVLAVGWGLDRFGTKYSLTELPYTVLNVFKGKATSVDCSNQVTKRLSANDAADVLRNLFCLKLPPYFGEDTDPVHGSLMVVNGALTGLYLQEERHPWGPQAAQYTGLAKTLKWLNQVIREPESIDYLPQDIM